VGERVTWTQIWKYRALGMQGDRLAGKMTISGGHSPPSRDGADIGVTSTRVMAHRRGGIYHISRIHTHKKKWYSF
jgi:hypothetical protein